MTIQVGLIGFGLSGSVFHAPLISAVEGLNLKTIVTSSAAAKVKKDYPNVEIVLDVDTLLLQKEIDVVVITSPNTTHYEYAKRAIKAGKHVVVEKPFTVTSAEADELIILAQKKEVILTVFQNRRWDNDFLTVRELLAANVLGTLATYEAHYDRFRPIVQDRWREKDLPGSGMLYDLGSHLIDQALTLFGLPQAVWADLRVEREGAEATDYFHILLSYDRFKVILHSGSLVRDAGLKFMLHGDKGSFIKSGLDCQEDQLKQGILPGDLGWGEDHQENYGRLTTEIGGIIIRGTVETLPGQYEEFYKKLVQSIELGIGAPVLAEDARNTIRVIEHAMTSHQEQRTVKFS
ncbi:oxidoreductase [Pelosinus sp. sgz500959]|uniref:oxidoreductase n=1 Tax=Pelosinus sp. sgz500959 TaxID=3242472 RepID=UPI00366D25E2